MKKNHSRRSLGKSWFYVARDLNGSLAMYTFRPTFLKRKGMFQPHSHSQEYIELSKSLFPEIKPGELSIIPLVSHLQKKLIKSKKQTIVK